MTNLRSCLFEVTENDRFFGQTIQEFRSERLVDLIVNTFFHAFERLIVASTGQIQMPFVLDRVSTDIGGHDQDHVAEVDVATESCRSTGLLP